MSIDRIVEGGVKNLEFVTAVKRRISKQYLDDDIITGIGICAGTTGGYAIQMYLGCNDDAAKEFVESFPACIEGVPVNITYVGKIVGD